MMQAIRIKIYNIIIITIIIITIIIITIIIITTLLVAFIIIEIPYYMSDLYYFHKFNFLLNLDFIFTSYKTAA